MNHRLLCALFTGALLDACAPTDGDAPDAPEASAEAYTGRAGDLRPTGLSATCVGGTITVQGAITHGGAQPVGASVAQVRFGVWPITRVDVTVPALAGGASASVALTRGGFGVGGHSVSLVADARGQVTEGSESNNSVGLWVQCPPPPPPPPAVPDLRVENLRAVCRPDGGAVFHWDLVNHGGAAAGGSRTYVRVPLPASSPGRPWEQRILTGSIPAGGRHASYFSYVVHEPGGVTVTADHDNDVRETSEHDNTAFLTFRGCP